MGISRCESIWVEQPVHDSRVIDSASLQNGQRVIGLFAGGEGGFIQFLH